MEGPDLAPRMGNRGESLLVFVKLPGMPLFSKSPSRKRWFKKLAVPGKGTRIKDTYACIKQVVLSMLRSRAENKINVQLADQYRLSHNGI